MLKRVNNNRDLKAWDREFCTDRAKVSLFTGYLKERILLCRSTATDVRLLLHLVLGNIYFHTFALATQTAVN